MGLLQEYLIMLLIVLVWLFLGFLRTVEPAAVIESTSVPSNLTTDAPKSVNEIEKEIEAMLTSVSKMALPYFVRNSDLKLSSSCMSTFIKMFVDIRKLKLPVIKLLDSMAKPPYGLLRGTFSIMGDYDECLEVRATKKGEVAHTKQEEYYHGQYCMVELEFPRSIASTLDDYNNKRVNISAFGKLAPFIAEFSATNFAKNYFTYKIGVCMPSTCSMEDLQEILGLVPVNFLPMRVKHCDDGEVKQLNTDQIVFIVVLVLFGILVISGTIFEAWLYLRYSTFKGYHKDKIPQFLLAFSIYGNTKKLLKSERSSSGADIPIINGMYVCGTFLVVIYHTYFMPFFLDFSSHGASLGDYLKDWKFTLLSTMGISIEAYFLFSGLFLVYPRYRREQKEVKINVFRILIRRYLRLCPSMLVILGIIVFVPLISSGPVWPEIFGVAAKNTRKWWWTYALMFNNFLEVKDQNFLYLWFIPCLMQITIIGAILLWIISKCQTFGIFLTIATGAACNIALGILTYYRNYPPTYAIYYYHNREYFEETIYTSPLSHVFSYGIGMLLGLFMAKNPTLKWSKTHVTIGWIVSLLMTTGSQFLCYIGYEGLDPDPTLAAIYAATHRTLFSLGMSWIILACTHGYGGVFAKILGWKAFGILGKLGYFGYLIHYIVITYHVSSTRVPLMYSHYEIFLRFCGYSALTFAGAYVLYITFELPLVFIESFFLPTRSEPNVQNNAGVQANGKRADVISVKYNDVLPSNIMKSTWNDQKSHEENGEQSKL